MRAALGYIAACRSHTSMVAAAPLYYYYYYYAAVPATNAGLCRPEGTARGPINGDF